MSYKKICGILLVIWIAFIGCQIVNPDASGHGSDVNDWGVILFPASVNSNGEGGSNKTSQWNYYQLSATGQTNCWDSAGSIIDCTSAVGQDGFYAPNSLRTNQFDLNGPIARETYSSLTWQRCTAGKSWNGSGCSGSFLALNHSEAVDYCNSLSESGLSWRLPTQRELTSIINYGSFNPALNTVVFPDSPEQSDGNSVLFWASTPLSTDTNQFFYIHNYYGAAYRNESAMSISVRCVSSLKDKLYSNSFKSNLDGTVFDRGTGLQWTKCSIINAATGEIDLSSDCSSGAPVLITYTQAINSCESLELAGRNDWRLPNIRELRSLIDHESETELLIDETHFPNTGISGRTGQGPFLAALYHASTGHEYSPDRNWGVNFGTGGTLNFILRTDVARFGRCVADIRD